MKERYVGVSMSTYGAILPGAARLARLLLVRGELERTVQRWVQRKAEELAAATGSLFEGGKGRRPGRFMRQA